MIRKPLSVRELLCNPLPDRRVSAPSFEAAGNCRDHCITDEVTVAVVEPLEPVDVDHHDRQRLVVALAAAPLGRVHLVEVTVVGDAGEAVDPREAHQLVVGGVDEGVDKLLVVEPPDDGDCPTRP